MLFKISFHKKAVLLIALIGTLTFANSLFNGFVGDDEVVIVRNDFYKDVRNLPRLLQPENVIESAVLFYKNEGDLGSGSIAFRPVSNLAYFVDCFLWRDHPAGYHFSGLFLHLLNSVLVYGLIFLLLGNSGTALFVALLFCVHPFKTEAVCAISYRHSMLVAFFVLLMFFAFIRGMAERGRRHVGGILAAVGMYLLAVFSTETAILAPILLWVYSVWKKCYTRDKLWVFLTFALATTFYLYVYFVVFPNSTLGENRSLAATWSGHVLGVFRIFFDYLVGFLNPLGVGVLPPLYIPGEASFVFVRALAGYLAFFGLLWVAVRSLSREKTLAFFVFWFIVFYLPSSGVVPLANPMAHRFVYLASVGFFAALVLALERLFSARRSWAADPRLQNGVIAIMVSVCMIQTIYLNGFWKSNYSLARKWVQDYPQDPKGYSILGIVYFRANQCSDAIVALNRSLELGLPDPRAYYMLGACSRADAGKAVAYFAQALTLAPEYAAPYQGLGELLYHQKRYDEARDFLIRALQLEPSVLGFGYLIKTDLALGRGNEAGMVFVQAQRQIKNKDDLDFLYALLTLDPTGQPHVKGAAR